MKCNGHEWKWGNIWGNHKYHNSVSSTSLKYVKVCKFWKQQIVVKMLFFYIHTLKREIILLMTFQISNHTSFEFAKITNHEQIPIGPYSLYTKATF